MSSKFVIRGGKPLKGETTVRGSKNAASKMMVASLLTEEPCVIYNVPLSVETDITKELCENVGSKVFLEEDHTCRIETPNLKTSIVPELTRKNRIPILAMGPLLHRRGFAEIPVLGGCPIGHRPINIHVEALSKMGIKIERRENSYYAEADSISGAEIKLPYPSVGATENIILSGVLALGNTSISNAAVGPEIINLIEMLKKMGASINVFPELREIEIDGVEKLHGVKITVIPDGNETVSLAIAALATEGDIFIKGADEQHLKTFLEKINEINGHYEVRSEGIRFWGQKPYLATVVETSPHPGFMTDWQQPFCVLLTQAQGESIIHETVYEDRFGYVKDLKRMGASIKVSEDCAGREQCRYYGHTFKHSACINGPVNLHGEKIQMIDIRAGMAHIIAALTARGKSIISEVEHIDRGYERLDERLKILGADIKRT